MHCTVGSSNQIVEGMPFVFKIVITQFCIMPVSYWMIGLQNSIAEQTCHTYLVMLCQHFAFGISAMSAAK